MCISLSCTLSVELPGKYQQKLHRVKKQHAINMLAFFTKLLRLL